MDISSYKCKACSHFALSACAMQLNILGGRSKAIKWRMQEKAGLLDCNKCL